MKTKVELLAVDCIDGMRILGSNTVDVCVTSPPYNLGIKYGTYQDSREMTEYLYWTEQWAIEVARILKTEGSLFLNISGSCMNPSLPFKVLRVIRRIYVLQNVIHWIKSISIESVGGSLYSFGHFKPINSPRFLSDCHEYIFHLTKKGTTRIDRLAVGVPYTDKSNIKRFSHTKGKDLRCRGNVWFIPYETIQNKKLQRPHPATFPVKLPEMCLRLQGNVKSLTVIDPFVGIGSSALAAVKLNVLRFIGFDIDKSYIASASQSVRRYRLWK